MLFINKKVSVIVRSTLRDQLHCNCTQLHLSITAIVTLFCRFVNKSSVYTQLSTRQLNARHIGDPELRTLPFYNLNNHHKQHSQLTKLKEGVCGYHQMNGDRALNLKCAPRCIYKPYAHDEKTSTKFLVDIGACLSIQYTAAVHQLQDFPDVNDCQ